MTKPAYEDRAPALVIEPETVQLAAELRAMRESRRDILLSSESPNGFPARWGRWIDREGGWEGFKNQAREVWLNEACGIEGMFTLLAIEEDRRVNGFSRPPMQ